MVKGKVLLKSELEEIVARIIEGRFKSLLHDIDYRIKVLYDVADRLTGANNKIGSHDLNLAHHILDGYVFTDNAPVAGSIAWTGCHIVYKGVDIAITDGDTASKYVWWDYSATPNTVFQTSATKPVLTADDVLVAINDNGMARVVMVPGKMVPGAAIYDGSINTNEIANGAINSDKLGALAVIESKIASGAITTDKIGDLQVTSPKIGAGAVGESKLNLATHLIY